MISPNPSVSFEEQSKITSLPEPDKQLSPFLWALQFNPIFYDHSAELIIQKQPLRILPLSKMMILGWSFLGGSLGTEGPCHVSSSA